MSKYFKKLIGEKCYLSPLSLQDAEHYAEWMNDFHITLNLGLAASIFTLEKEREALENLQKGNNYVFAIIDRESNKLIGSTGLHQVNLIDGNSELGINIGDKNFWNRSYGRDAMKLMLDFAFNILNLHTVYLKVLDFNQRAYNSYKAVGFKEFGRMKGARKIAQQRYDMIYMQIMAEDYKSCFIENVVNETQTNKGNLELKLEI